MHSIVPLSDKTGIRDGMSFSYNLIRGVSYEEIPDERNWVASAGHAGSSSIDRL
jgi:hypothetical protein